MTKEKEKEKKIRLSMLIWLQQGPPLAPSHRLPLPRLLLPCPPRPFTPPFLDSLLLNPPPPRPDQTYPCRHPLHHPRHHPRPH